MTGCPAGNLPSWSSKTKFKRIERWPKLDCFVSVKGVFFCEKVNFIFLCFSPKLVKIRVFLCVKWSFFCVKKKKKILSFKWLWIPDYFILGFSFREFRDKKMKFREKMRVFRLFFLTKQRKFSPKLRKINIYERKNYFTQTSINQP